ncbi:TPA: hypothetical protein N0F65_006984 [Lagenidium giganteum]|uniref:Uncharacterized protein n=1 Tax=Lagenidium giganteum TaxID=4803 RepID=A0AAV2ZJB5_9STRA|nr:TPA: hypothetical protein N0F65_006984 [Lagenidium giganteum]
MSADLPPTHLIRAKARHNRTNDLSLLESNTDRVQRRIEREDIFKLMHLVARVADDEVLLCTLSFHVENGLLCMTPGFSAYCDVGTDPDAATKGPKLSTLTFKTERSGVAFEYALDNEHDLIPSVLPEDWQLENELRRLDIKQAQVQVAELVNRSGQGTANASIKPDAPRERRVAILMELVSLYGADADTKIYVDYELHGLSPQWKPQTTALDGQTQLSQGADIADIGNMHAFNFHVRYDLGWHNASKAPGTAPEADVNDRVGVVLMRAFACDSWKRKKLIGCGELHVPTTSGFNDVNVRLWKPVQSIREQMEDYFIGMDELVPRFDSHAHQQAFRSRLGLETESAACHLRVRLNVAIERPQEVSVVTMNSRDLNASLVPTTTQAVKRSVNEILQSLKLEKAMATTSDKQMKAALRSMSIGGLSAVNTVLGRTPNTSS